MINEESLSHGTKEDVASGAVDRLRKLLEAQMADQQKVWAELSALRKQFEGTVNAEKMSLIINLESKVGHKVAHMSFDSPARDWRLLKAAKPQDTAEIMANSRKPDSAGGWGTSDCEDCWLPFSLQEGVEAKLPIQATNLDCYWVGSLDFNFLVETKETPNSNQAMSNRRLIPCGLLQGAQVAPKTHWRREFFRCWVVWVNFRATSYDRIHPKWWLMWGMAPSKQLGS